MLNHKAHAVTANSSCFEHCHSSTSLRCDRHPLQRQWKGHLRAGNSIEKRRIKRLASGITRGLRVDEAMPGESKTVSFFWTRPTHGPFRGPFEEPLIRLFVRLIWIISLYIYQHILCISFCFDVYIPYTYNIIRKKPYPPPVTIGAKIMKSISRLQRERVRPPQFPIIVTLDT